MSSIETDERATADEAERAVDFPLGDPVRAIRFDELVDREPLAARKTVPVPEWGEGVGVVVRGLSMEEFEGIQADAVDADTGNPLPAKAAILAVLVGTVDPDLDPNTHYAVVARQEPSSITRISNVIMELSGLGPDFVKEMERSFRGARRPR